ncbi:MAG: class I SAM-dependent methyltransferase family protein [Candidatus Bathyarchaeota archaeon]|nr:class I SAM-dependent methyltransferase family protein [Candidatus Bathyarchaeota archaeon]
MLSFDVIGDIAIIKCFPILLKQKNISIDIFAKILEKNKHIKTVLCQKGGINGEYRLGNLEWVFGEQKTDTVHKEYGCKFYVDLNHVYFSPRLSFERMRIAQETKNGEKILNMFGGVGSFSIMISRYVSISKIYSIDINPKAIQYALKNIKLNKINNKIVSIMGDARYITMTHLSNKVDRVLMPLPLKSFEYLIYAVRALKKRGMIHYYDFVHSTKSEDPIEKVTQKVSINLCKQGIDHGIKFARNIRSIGPNWHQIVLDIKIK